VTYNIPVPFGGDTAGIKSDLAPYNFLRRFFMGQYYKPLLITHDGRVLTLDPHEFGSFSKLTEHSWISNEFVSAAYSLIRGNRKRVAWIGDYAYQEYEECDEPYTKAMLPEEFQKFYDVAWNENSESLPANLFSKRDFAILDFDTKGMFLVNHSKRTYIDMAAFIRENTTRGGDWDGWCMNPLPLLTACGNGRGGGDFGSIHVGYENIGTWAFDWLEYTKTPPANYETVTYYFDEH
jgi:hypothetical protein